MNEEFVGEITYNVVNLVSNGTKKIFNAYILLKDLNGTLSSYKVVSFRSQVIYQSEKLGVSGIKGKVVKFKGKFKENVWNGQTTFQLMAEEMFIEGMEHLAEEAKQADTTQPKAPAQSLAPAGATLVHTPAAVQVPVPAVQVPVPTPVTMDTTLYPSAPTLVTPTAPNATQSSGPGHIPGGFKI